jgi:hypothetical protein
VPLPGKVFQAAIVVLFVSESPMRVTSAWPYRLREIIASVNSSKAGCIQMRRTRYVHS